MEKRKLQVVQMNDALAESVRSLVNPPMTQLPELSFESVVTTGELDMLVSSAQQVLEQQPTVKTQLATGDKVKVTRFAAPFPLDGKQHFVRLMQYRGDKRSDDVYVIFDMTESPEQIMVRDPSLFRLESGDDTVRGVYVYCGGDMPELNEREHVSFAEWVLMGIVEVGEKYETEQVQVLQREKSERELQKEQDRRNKSYRRERRWDDVVEFAPLIALGTCAVGLLGLLGYVIANEEEPVNTFDKQHYELEGGTIARLGDSGVTPAFSFDLLHNDKLEPEDVPEIGNTESAAGPIIYEGENRDDRARIDKLRQVRVQTDDSDESCETTFVHFDSPNDVVRVWTDYQGDSKDFDVTVGNDTVRVCWNGPELKDGEMPRIVVQRQPAEVPQSHLPR